MNGSISKEKSRTDSTNYNINRLLIIVLTVGSVLLGYGFGVELRFFPGQGFIIGFIVYVFTAIGAVMVSLTGLVAAWLTVRESTESLQTVEAAAITVVAPFIAAAVVTPLSYYFNIWVLVGQAVLSLAFLVGFVVPWSRRYLALSGATVAVAVLIVGSSVATEELINVGSLLFLSASGAFLFLLFGGPLFILGNHLNIPPNESSPE